MNVTFGERGGSPRLTEFSNYVISVYSGSVDQPVCGASCYPSYAEFFQVLVDSSPTVAGAYDPNRGLQTAVLDPGGSMGPDS